MFVDIELTLSQVGGLGHFAVLFAKALGADKVIGLSRRAEKKESVLALGADEYIATEDDKEWWNAQQRTLDLIICTVSSSNMPIDHYLSLLKPDSSFIQVGAPDDGNMPAPNVFTLIKNRIKVGGSMIGAPHEIREMLAFAAEKKIKPWIELRPMSEANQAVQDLVAGKPRYRYVLYNPSTEKQ